MRVVVLGATGRLGRHVVHECVGTGHEVVAVTRGEPPADGHGTVRWATVQPEDVEAHHRLFSQTDGVLDARNQRYDDWSRYPAMVDATLAALRDTRARYVYVDNLYAYGVPATSAPVDENTPRRPVSVKGQIRRDIERGLIAAMTTHPVTIVRFPDFYGISTDPLPGSLRWFGPPALSHQFIHVPDAAHAVRLILQDPTAAGEVWHVAGAAPITGYQLRDVARGITGRPTRLTVMGRGLVRVLGLISGPARGLVETQYLWETPMFLDASKFGSRFDTRFFHTHREALREIMEGEFRSGRQAALSTPG